MFDWIGEKAVAEHHKHVPFHLLQENESCQLEILASATVPGELWEKRSGGKCLFVMPKGKDLQAIKEKLSPKKQNTCSMVTKDNNHVVI